MPDCSYGATEWCCCLQEGHEGPHQSQPLALDREMTAKYGDPVYSTRREAKDA